MFLVTFVLGCILSSPGTLTGRSLDMPARQSPILFLGAILPCPGPEPLGVKERQMFSLSIKDEIAETPLSPTGTLLLG